MPRIKIFALIFAVFITLLDQFTKYLALKALTFYEAINVFSVNNSYFNFGFNWFLTYNYGTAFSFIKTASKNEFLIILSTTMLIIVALLYWLYKELPNNKLVIFSLGLVIGGALGNIYDRLVHGYVIDFADFYAGKWHWPVFNLADTVISIGVLLLFLHAFSTDRAERASKRSR